MNASGDAAETVVRITLDGAEHIIKIAGKGTAELATFLYAAAHGSKRTKGKTRLAGMLRSGKELKVFSLKESDLHKFTQEAKKYGVLFCALRGVKKDKDGMVDIMVRAEDGSKVNRIFDRFAIAAVDTAEIRSELLKNIEEHAAQSRDNPEKPAEVMEAEKEAAAPTAEKPHTQNPQLPRTDSRPNGNRSENTLNAGNRISRIRTADTTSTKPSVREQIEEIRASHRSDSEKKTPDRKGRTTHHKPNHKPKPKRKER